MMLPHPKVVKKKVLLLEKKKEEVHFGTVTLVQEDLRCNLKVVVSKQAQDVMQGLMVAGESVFMEMMHQQLLRLIYSACEGQSNNRLRTSLGDREL